MEIKGLLIDLDGVLTIDGIPVSGAIEAISELKVRRFPFRVLTNMTIKPKSKIVRDLQQAGFKIETHDVVCVPDIAVKVLKNHNITTCLAVVNESVKPAFADFQLTDHQPDAVLIGDIGERWDYSLMSLLFDCIMEGAEFYTLHKGKFWKGDGKLKLDIGAFVAGLEYVTNQTATVLGKPNPLFFETGAREMALDPSEVMMIGDDIESDIGGAQSAGIKGVLVKTGKFKSSWIDQSVIKPDLVIDSIANILDHIP